MFRIRIFLIAVFICLLSPLSPSATMGTNLKAVFVRDKNLWLLSNSEEKQITKSGEVFSQPKWSHDGKYILYQSLAASEFEENEQQHEIWVYEMETGEKQKVFYDASYPNWAPNKNVVAFNALGILNISDLKQFYNIATGVDGYTWNPSGSGFLLSTSGVLQPDGWTSASLYKKTINKNFQDIVLYGGVDHVFTLPKEIGIGNNKIIAIFADQITFSPSKKWISFIVSPTASWSMDSNMLCVISSDGKKFEILDEVVFEVGHPKWAPSSDTIAFIAGGGRLVFGFKNKDLKLREMPVSGSYTPPNYLDLDFDWVTDRKIVTSRMEEREWSNQFKEHPLPSLHSIDLVNNKQVKLTTPPRGYGDYSPQYVKGVESLVWYRGTSLIDSDQDIWKANIDGSNAEKWIENVEAIDFYFNETT